MRKFYDDLSVVTERLDNATPKQIKNVPIEIYISRWIKGVSAGAVTFYGGSSGTAKGIFRLRISQVRTTKLEKDKFEQFASKRLK